MTDAQDDALKRLRKRYRGTGTIETLGYDDLNRMKILLPGEDEYRRRLRAITESGVVERVNPE